MHTKMVIFLWQKRFFVPYWFWYNTLSTFTSYLDVRKYHLMAIYNSLKTNVEENFKAINDNDLGNDIVQDIL